MDGLTGHITRGYELKERIGEGGFGAVYRAFQPSVGREVAIKVILPDYANRPDFIRRFETEAQLVARLEHPFIVPLFDYWRDPGGAYLVMRFFRGGSVRQQLRERRFEPHEVFRLVDQIAGALAVAHRNGVIHRDLKPDNILLDEDGNAYLTDFGIAKANLKGEEEEEEGISGSPGYMAPEQIINNPITAQTDIYSLGIMIYEILVGQHPFSSSSTTELIFKHLQEPLPNIELVHEELPSQVNEVIQRATAKDATERFPDVLTLVKALRQALLPDAGSQVVIGDEDYSVITNPYKGLRAFEEADATDFFGRETLINQLVGRLSESGEYARFLAVVGPSGSGKSSVVKAGLLPALRWGDVPGSDEWFIAEMVPGATPLEKLESALLGVAIKPSHNLLEQLRRDERGLLSAVEAVLPEGAEFLLVIDQFEELFTLVESEAERIHFLNILRSSVLDPRSRIRIVVTLRADFYDRPLLYEGFGTLMRTRTEIVLPLSAEELERSIRGPAERVGLVVDTDLLAAIVSDVREEPGALPLLQYVLTELFERRQGRVLTLEAYQASGGALGALARRAEDLFSQFDVMYQQITRQVFLRLVTLGEGTEDTRRRVQWAELMSFGVNRDSLQAVLDAFGRYRLLSFDRDPQTREPTVEVAHEALIREWARLREWLSASRHDVRMQRNLSSGAAEWERSARDSSFLLRGVRLSQFEAWAQETDLVLTQEERDYLRASIVQREALEAAEAERRAREAELERRSRNQLRILVAVLGVAFVLALVLSIFAFTQSQEAQSERDNAQTQVAIAATAAHDAHQQETIAQREAAVARSLALAANARQLETLGNYPLALALALEANSIANPPDQVQRILAGIAFAPGMIRRLGADAGEGHGTSVTSVATAPNGIHILSGATDGTLLLWNAHTGQIERRFEGHTLPIACVAISPDGKFVVSGSWDTTLIVWDAVTGAPIRILRGHRGAVNTVAISSDGRRALSGSTDGLILWDIETGEILKRLTADIGTILSVSLSPDNTMALVGSQDSVLLLWNLDSDEIAQRFRGHTSDVLSVAVSPDGAEGLSSSRDNSIILWDLSTGREIRRFGVDTEQRHSLPVNSVAFSPDGRFILTGSEDNLLIMWDVQTGQVMRRFEGHTDSVVDVAFTPDGRMAVTGSDDTTLILWSVTDSGYIRVQQGNASSANSVDYSQDGLRAVSGFDDGVVIIWNVETGDQLLRLEGHSGAVTDVSFSDNGAFVASCSEDHNVIVWDAVTGAIIHQLEGHGAPVNTVDFHPDNEQLVSGGDDNNLVLWNGRTGEIIRRFEGHTRRVLSASFSPDGRTMLSGSADRTLILWDVNTGQRVYTLQGHERRVLDVAYSPDGSLAVSGSDDTTVILWNLETGSELRRFSVTSEGAPRAVFSVDYSSDGRTAILGLEDGSVMLWDTVVGQSTRQYTPVSSSGISQIAFSPDGNMALSSSRDGRLVLWRTPALQGLIEWTRANRYIPVLTCDQHEQYGTGESCDESE